MTSHRPKPGAYRLLAMPAGREDVQPANGKSFILKELQGFVGGYIEIQDIGGGLRMVLNEEGKLRGLPSNLAATILFREAHRGNPWGERETITGDVLVCHASQLR